ncbi:MAG: hypothetical protein RLZZ502_886 [Pseudomonadota bacterium]|jgi:RimJ/RimL family protein N-acetyltransferase
MRDARTIHEAIMESVEEIGRWQSWCTHRYSLADALAFCRASKIAHREQTEFNYLVVDADTQRVHGVVSLNQLRPMHGVANLGYWLRSSSVGQGIMSCAVRQCAERAFQRHGLQRLEIVADVNNRRSRKVAERVGAHYEGIARQRLRYRGEPRDARIYALVKQ